MSQIYYYGYKFLIDETPMASLPNDWIKTDFFRKNCFIPEEIIIELENNPNLELEELKKNKIPVTYSILCKLVLVMAQAKIVKLYQNEGNGDALIIATALAMKDQEDTKLLKNEWIIVTSDRGVASLAKNFAIKSIKKEEFYDIMRKNLV